MAKVVLRRPFLAPDGRIYKRHGSGGEVLVHDFPSDWKLPTTSVPAEEAVAELVAPPAAVPEPETLSELARVQHGKK